MAPRPRERADAVVLAIFFLGFTLRLLIAVATHAYKSPVYGETICVAISIDRQGVFGNPFNAPTGPTAHVAPVYSYFLALILKLVPWGPAFGWVAILLGAFGASLCWALLPRCGEKLGLERRVGVLAGIFGAVYPFRQATELQGQWEASYAAIALMELVVFTIRWEFLQSTRRAWIWGALWGCAMLLQPAFLPVFLAFLGFGWYQARFGLKVGQRAGVALAGMALAVTPWTVRIYRQLGGLVFVRDNFGLELSISNNPHAFPNIHENLHMNPKSDHPDVNLLEKRKLAEMGELAYNRSRLRSAVEWIRNNPHRFLQLTARRIACFWAPQRRSVLLMALEALVSLASLFGLLAMFRRGEFAAWTLALIGAVYPMVYYVIQMDERYRFPMEWCVALCASYGALYLGSRFREIARRPVASSCILESVGK